MTDSVFFYFAGHGEYHFDNSALQFHDNFVQIADIFSRINDLQPKYQCFVIDACESGGKVLTRGSSDTDLIEKYISKSSGILFMYAATDNEKAKELSRIKHGLFTYYFLDAINNDSLYDEEGILTPNRIQDYIARETSKESQFKQTPVIENRTIGYYPFAFKTKPDTEQKEIARGTEEEKESSLDKIYFPQIPNEIRQQVSDELRSAIATLRESVKVDFNLDDYEITVGDDLNIFNHNIHDKLTDGIVEKSRKENVEAVNLLFSTERQENTPNPLFGSLGMIEALMQRKQPKYTYYNRIQWHDERVVALSLNLKSNNIYKVSCGILVVAYQAIYGVGLATASFYMDYTGYNDTQLNGPYSSVDAFKVHNKTISNLKEAAISHLNYFKGMIEKWNTERQKSISSFDSKAK
jgi:Caspase domain